MRKYSKIISTPMPQSEPLNEQQVENNAGGFVFQIDRWARLDRFLILGSDAPTYYQKARDLTIANAKVVTECFDENAERTVNRIVEISTNGRAPKNDPAIFALAIGTNHHDVKCRQLALAAMPNICRTSTHLFQFVSAAHALKKGWGRAFKRAITEWYDKKDENALAYQMIKYRSREDYTHKRLLDMSHAPARNEKRKALYHWAKGLEYDLAYLPEQVKAHLDAMTSDTTKNQFLDLIKKNRLPWEALPTEANINPKVWETMLPDMGLTALIRNLGNMTRVGTITPLSKAEMTIVARLGSEIELRKSRVHPFNILLAHAIYKSGHGMRGSGEWKPSQPIVSALDDAFYAAFANVQPTGKRHFIALDVSGSMSIPFMGSPLTCAEGTAALSLVTMNVEPHTHVMGFADGLRDLGLTRKMSLASAVKKVSNLTVGGTDCALPMIYALKHKIEADVFIVMTDNETWAGRVHPTVALADYRKKMGINAKLIVVGMTATGFSIADPKDAGMLDIVGFDANCPALIADFARQ